MDLGDCYGCQIGYNVVRSFANLEILDMKSFNKSRSQADACGDCSRKPDGVKEYAPHTEYTAEAVSVNGKVVNRPLKTPSPLSDLYLACGVDELQRWKRLLLDGQHPKVSRRGAQDLVDFIEKSLDVLKN